MNDAISVYADIGGGRGLDLIEVKDKRVPRVRSLRPRSVLAPTFITLIHPGASSAVRARARRAFFAARAV